MFTAALLLTVAFHLSAFATGEPRPPERIALWTVPTPVGGGKPAADDAAISTPSYANLAGGAQAIRLLHGQQGFVFSMYNSPGDLRALRQLVGVMREQKLGNGLDPGPTPTSGAKPVFDYLATVGWPVMFYSGAEMQIKGGRSVLGREHESAISAMDRAGIFTAFQLAVLSAIHSTLTRLG